MQNDNGLTLTPAACEVLADALNETFGDYIDAGTFEGWTPSDLAGSFSKNEWRGIGMLLSTSGRMAKFLEAYSFMAVDYALNQLHDDNCPDPYCPHYLDGATLQ